MNNSLMDKGQQGAWDTKETTNVSCDRARSEVSWGILLWLIRRMISPHAYVYNEPVCQPDGER